MSIFTFVNSRVGITAIVLFILIRSGCGGSDVQRQLSAEERFELGKHKFDDGDYLEAISDFDIIKLQFPGSALADDAQFYIAESRFNRDEFLLAAEEYLTLRRTMPSSPFDTLAQFNIARCYYNLSPPYQLDQRYTNRAIDEFQAFIEYFPNHPLAADAARYIQELNGRRAQKDYESAEMYMNMEYYRAATVYFDAVIEHYHDTPFAEPALLGKIRALIARKRYAEAEESIDKFMDRYPQSKDVNEVKNLRETVREQMSAATTRVH